MSTKPHPRRRPTRRRMATRCRCLPSHRCWVPAETFEVSRHLDLLLLVLGAWSDYLVDAAKRAERYGDLRSAEAADIVRISLTDGAIEPIRALLEGVY